MANPQQATATQQAQPPVQEKTVTVVINNREGIEIVQFPHRGKDNHGRVMIGDQLVLLPGLNLVDTEQLAVLMKNELFAAKFTTKIPRSLAPEQNPERMGRPVLVRGKDLPAYLPLSKLTPQEAIDIVEEANEEQLPRFKADETRESVLRAILKRIDELATGENTTAQDF